jgi:hypothetical protein
MRMIIALIVIVYIIGIGVVLSPTVRDKWNGASASEFATNIVQALPNAMAWPETVYRSRFGRV